ncbi:ATP-grasp domain-containing protein [Cellulomonas phragmiteti]|uniref:Carboxylase n=1 Tax=Cellulomonas phragmiteti TaxID=478780 RepID=A0ABQ4DNQ7_9CELL|nr:ATP-grasp domain-containing protein [Cellulomonas phragmiteti]GIG40975.1 carboxylase [Cellulomonas phragmiteti]
MDAEPLLAIVGQVPRAFREYALAGARHAARVWLVTPSAQAWHGGYCERVEEVDLDGAHALREVSALLAGQVDGVLTFDERYVELTAALVERLGLPGATVEAVRVLKDKAALREATAGRPYAVRFGIARTVAEAHRVVASIGYPVVLKPRALGGSIGVVKVDGPSGLDAAFRLADGARVGDLASAHAGVLVEEFVDGPEISIDASVSGGRTHVHFVADKLLGPEPYFEEVGHVVPSAVGDLQEVLDTVEDVHRLSGFDDGVSHVELRLTDRGPRLIEANARLGGDLIPYLGLRATGVDLARVAAQIAVGRPVPVEAARDDAAAVRFVYADRPLVLAGVTWPEAAHPGVEVERAGLLAPGSWTAPPPDAFLSRVAYVLAHGSDRDLVVGAVEREAGAVRVDGEQARV